MHQKYSNQLRLICVAAAFVFSTGLLAGAEETVAWECDCSTSNGWFTKNMNTRIEKDEADTIKVVQDGNDSWGKAAFVVENINLADTPILEVKVNEVEKGSAFKVGIAPRDWSEFIEVIERSSADGIHEGDIEDAIKKQSKKPKEAWEGPVSFNVVVIIEGKSKYSYFDNFMIRPK